MYKGKRTNRHNEQLILHSPLFVTFADMSSVDADITHHKDITILINSRNKKTTFAVCPGKLLFFTCISHRIHKRSISAQRSDLQASLDMLPAMHCCCSSRIRALQPRHFRVWIGRGASHASRAQLLRCDKLLHTLIKTNEYLVVHDAFNECLLWEKLSQRNRGFATLQIYKRKKKFLSACSQLREDVSCV